MWRSWAGEKRLQGFGWETEGKRPLGRPRRRGRITVAGFCEHGNEPLGSIKKAGYFLKR
jgi:hypothetical protein